MARAHYNYLPSPGRISNDGLTYWNGAAWVSTVSPDGKQRWDGVAWREQPGAARLSYGAVRLAIKSLGILGCLAMGVMALDVYVDLTRSLGPTRLVVPWGLVLLILRRAWMGRWLGAAILACAWVIGLFTILLFGPPVVP